MAINPARLRAIREKRGLSQRELARICEIGETQIYRYENKLSDPSSDHVGRIAKHLRVSTDYLYGFSDKEQGQFTERPLTAEERRILDAIDRNDIVTVLDILRDRFKDVFNKRSGE